jgi:hypothetical protein
MGRVVHMLDGRIVDDAPGMNRDTPGDGEPRTADETAGEPLDPGNQHG